MDNCGMVALYPSDGSDGYRTFLDSLLDGTRTQASSADLHPFYGACLRNHNPYLLEVGVPDLLCLVVRVTDAVPYDGPLTADLTKSRHNKLLSENQAVS